MSLKLHNDACTAAACAYAALDALGVPGLAIRGRGADAFARFSRLLELARTTGAEVGRASLGLPSSNGGAS